MKLQRLSEGLANQIRHYIFVRYAQRECPGDEWVFDDSYFYIWHMHPQIELPLPFQKENPAIASTYQLKNIFGLALNLFSQHFQPDEWGEIIRKIKLGKSIPQIFLDNGMPMVLVEGKSNGFQLAFNGKVIFPSNGHMGYQPKYIRLPYENIYYNADWASPEWFMRYAEENRKELMFPPLVDRKNQDYCKEIRSSFSVGIHVRRGDFSNFGWILPAEIYLPACKQVLREHPDAHFFVFSDDLDWCCLHEKELGFSLAKTVTYVSGNTGKNSYIDMQLLSMCKGIIRNAKSSFSQVAGWLNPNLEFEIKLNPESCT